MDKVDFTWEDIEDFINKVVNYIKENNLKFTGIYGIPRGGLILSTLLSYRLNLPLLLAPIKGCLIIDDIADSGRTLLHYTENDTQFNKYIIITMVYHERSLVKPDFYLYIKKDQWVNFP